MKKLAWLLMMVSPLCFSMPTGQVAAGAEKSASCIACHNQDGNSTIGLYPKLAGQHASYTYNQLMAFKEGADGSRGTAALMIALVPDLSEQDLADMSVYFAAQQTTPGSTPENMIELGEALYRAGDKERSIPACMACHGPAGRGMDAAAIPAVSGQHAEYLIKTLTDYKSGARSNGVNAIMTQVAMKLTEDEIQAVSHYMSGLHPETTTGANDAL